MKITQFTWEQLGMLHALANIAIDLPRCDIITAMRSERTIRKELDLPVGRLYLHIAIDQLMAPAMREYFPHLAQQHMIPGLQEDVVELIVVVFPRIGFHF